MVDSAPWSDRSIYFKMLWAGDTGDKDVRADYGSNASRSMGWTEAELEI